MSHKLTPERLAEIRQANAKEETAAEGPRLFTDAECHREELLLELDRTRPSWTSVRRGQHTYGRTYQVAGTTAQSEKPIWLGRGKYDTEWQKWVDDNTGKPFPVTTTITHYYKELTPTEYIGQPE